MRIAFYDDSSAFGGHEIMLCRLLSNFRYAPGFDILALFSHVNRDYLDKLGFKEGTQGNLTLYFLPFSNPLRFGNIASLFAWGRINRVTRFLNAFSPNVVVIAQGGIDTCTIGALASKLLNYRTVSYIPNLNGYSRTNPSLKNRIRDRLNRPFHRIPHEFIVIRQGQVSELRALGFKGLIHVVYNGIDFSRLTPIPKNSARQEIEFGENNFCIGVVGRIDLVNKRQDFLVHAMIQASEGFNDVRILYVGDGDDTAFLQDLIRNSEFQNRIKLIPFRTDLSPIYSALDALIIPSKSEGMPLVMIEALSMGIPVLASAIDGMKEILPPEWLFEPGNVNSFLECLRILRSRSSEKISHDEEYYRQLARNVFSEKNFLDGFLTALTPPRQNQLSQRKG